MSNDNPINILIAEFNNQENHVSDIATKNLGDALRESASVLMDLGKIDYAISYRAIADQYT